jgi:GNAT superfamily N-acetyltransferase
VSPVARGRGLGLGTSLLAAVSSWASAHDFRLMLNVVDGGAPAIKLYERIGWRLVNTRQADWVTPQDERLPVLIYLAPDGE